MHELRARFHQKNMIKGDNPQQHALIFNEWCPHPHHDFTQKSSCAPLWHSLIEHLWFIHHTKFIETTPFPSAYSFLLSLSPLLTTQPQTFLCVKMLLSLTEDQLCLSTAISVVVFLYVVLLVLESSWRNIGVSWLTQVDCCFPHFVAERLTAAAVDKGSRDVSCLKDKWEVLYVDETIFVCFFF